MTLASLRENYHAVVFGAQGGVGGAFVKAFADDPRCTIVHAGGRSMPEAGEKRLPFTFDLLDEDAIERACGVIVQAGTPDIVIVATGVLHNGLLAPEKALSAIRPESLLHSYAINAVGPALIAKHLVKHLPRERKSVFAALSARVSSIADNHSGGWHGYRASKAALNMLIRNAALELALRNKNAVCVGLHPGTVDTAMSKPFQTGVLASRLFTPQISVSHLMVVIDRLTPADTGQLFAWDGAIIT